MPDIKRKDPYLLGPDRLADVLAGIQFLGTYRYYKVGFEYWQKRIKARPKSDADWKQVFLEHPEFFRVSEKENNVCLLLRRARRRNYHVDTGRTLSKKDRRELPESERENKITRAALEVGEVRMLLDVAIDLHGRAIAHQAEVRRFWVLIPSILASATAIAVAIIKVGGA